jgi:hypothetical protein
MPDHHCRYCHDVLTLDNIYPSDHKHKNWICKTCSNQKKKDRQQRQYNNRSNPKDVTFNQKADELVEHITRSCANHIRTTPDPKSSIERSCGKCFWLGVHYGESTCHRYPPIFGHFPKIEYTDWCGDYQEQED